MWKLQDQEMRRLEESRKRTAERRAAKRKAEEDAKVAASKRCGVLIHPLRLLIIIAMLTTMLFVVRQPQSPAAVT